MRRFIDFYTTPPPAQNEPEIMAGALPNLSKGTYPGVIVKKIQTFWDAPGYDRVRDGCTLTVSPVHSPSGKVHAMEEPVNEAPTAQDHAIELARWYHELAKLCIHAAEQIVQLTEDSAHHGLLRCHRRTRGGGAAVVRRPFYHHATLVSGKGDGEARGSAAEGGS